MTSEADTEDGEGAQESGGEGEGPSVAISGGALLPPHETQAVPPAPQGVARRTRAHVSLAHYEIEQLEEFLTVRVRESQGRIRSRQTLTPPSVARSWSASPTFSCTTTTGWSTRRFWRH